MSNKALIKPNIVFLSHIILGSHVNLTAICVKLKSVLHLQQLILPVGLQLASRCHCCVRFSSTAGSSGWSQSQAICVFGCVCACRQQSGQFPWKSIISSIADVVKANTEYRMLPVCWVCTCASVSALTTAE